MNGVLRTAAYVPVHRLDLADIGAHLGRGAARGSRSVASYDEDPTSMAVEAGRQLIWPDSRPGRLLFTTTSPPYLDKTNAAAVHAALGLAPTTLAVDLIGSARSATAALLGAAEAGETTLVVAGDIVAGRPGSVDERTGGDGAGAVLFGRGTPDRPVIADVLGHAAVTLELLDRWRHPADAHSSVWEERFGEGVLVQAGRDCLDQLAARIPLVPDEVDTLLVCGPHRRAVRQVAASTVGGATGPDPVGTVGACGAAEPLARLHAALLTATPGQLIVILVLSDGASAVALRVTDAIDRHRPVSAPPRVLPLAYSTYLRWRGHLSVEPPRRPEPSSPAAPPTFRSVGYKFAFQGSRCVDCTRLHLPPARVCIGCGAIDRMDPEAMSDRTGTVVTFTLDHLAYAPSSPVIAAVVDFDGGGRVACELTDVDPSEVSVGLRVGMTFRRLTTAHGVHNYFWKARPDLGWPAETTPPRRRA